MSTRITGNNTKFSNTLLSHKNSSLFHRIYYWLISIPFFYRNKTRIKYASVGLSGEIVDYLILFLLTTIFNVFYLLSAFVSYTFAIFVNFNFQKKQTFKYRTRNLKEYLNSFFGFFTVSITGLVSTIVLMAVLVSLFNIHYIIAKLITGMIVFALNFNGHSIVLSKPKIFIWKK